MTTKEDNKNQFRKRLFIVGVCGAGVLMAGCVAAVPVVVTPATGVVTPVPAVVAPVGVVRPVAPVARAASPVGVHGTARRTSRRVARRH